jgi:hypothetical protein
MVIEQVEKVRSEARMLSFANLEYFLQGQVHILLRGPSAIRRSPAHSKTTIRIAKK